MEYKTKTIRTVDASELVRHIADPLTPAWVHDGPLTIDEARAEFDRRFPVQPAPVSGWQPIESAPRDGTDVLLFIGNGRDDSKSYYLVCRFNVANESWYGPKGYVYPLWWMPLPEAPR